MEFQVKILNQYYKLKYKTVVFLINSVNVWKLIVVQVCTIENAMWMVLDSRALEK
jgi:hypothetical protein